MMHTEESAKKLWCPMARDIQNTDKYDEAGTWYVSNEGSKCIASSCMMWQWLDDEERMEERRGFCGLARR